MAEDRHPEGTGCTKAEPQAPGGSGSRGSGPASPPDNSLYLPSLSFHSCEMKVEQALKVSRSLGISTSQLCLPGRRHQ